MEGTADVSPRTFWSECCVIRRIRMLLPVGFKTEIIALSKLAGPVLIAQFMGYAIGLVSTVFCGHLGKTELAAVSLALSVINVMGISVGFGLAAACDTLISQTFGSGNFLRVGITVQRAILILLLACFPCWAILINTELILLAVKQEPAVARLAQQYVQIFMPALPAAFMYSLQVRYLQNQGIIWPEILTGLLVNLLNALLNYILLYQLHQGVQGSAAANALSQFAMPGILYCYIIWKGLHKSTWGGWSRECLHDWSSYIRLAIPSMAMLCVEWWTFEIGNFLAGLVNEVELGAQSIIFQISNFAYMFPLSFSIAGNIRVGNALGAGDQEQAKLSAKLTMLCAVSVSLWFSVLIGGLKDHISYVFTYDEQIKERVADVISLYAPFIILEATSAATGGIIRGSGKQKIGALSNIFGFYGVGFPIGVPLMFAAKLGIKGLWTGILVSLFLQDTFLIIYLMRLKWNKVTEEAQIRAGVRGSCSDTDDSEKSEDQADTINLVETKTESDDSENTEDQADTVNLVETEAEPAVKSLKEQLAYRTVVLYRCLALAHMIFILAAGIITKLVVTNLVAGT